MTTRRTAALSLSLLLMGISSAPARGQDSEGSSRSTHFEITWENDPSSPDAPDLTDSDADGVPDAIVRVLGTFERARGFLVDELGYRAPPNEDAYPTFVAEAQGLGYTQPLFLTQEQSQPSYILVPLRLVRADVDQGQLDIFAVHEFHHAIQLGYDSLDDHWLREATSTWLEDVWRDDLDRNHLLLRPFVPQPHLPLDFVGSQHEYGAFLYLQFLSERYDNGSTTLVRDIWQKLAEPAIGSLAAIESVLASRGIPLSSAWGEFLLWRWRLEHFSEGQAYIGALAGSGWPVANTVEPVAADSCRREIEPMPPLAASYIKVQPARDAPDFALAHVSVYGPPGSAGMAEFKLKDLPAAEQVLIFDTDGVARFDLAFGRRQARRLVLGLSTTERPFPGLERPLPLAWSLRYDGMEATGMGPLQAPSKTTAFNGAQISGDVTCGGLPAPGVEITVTETDASGEGDEYPAVSGPDGSWVVIVSPQSRSSYTASVTDPLLGGAESGPVTVQVAIEVSLVVTDPQVELGDPLRLAGRTFPALEGTEIEIQFRRPERPWRSGPMVRTGPEGDYAAELILPRPGVWVIRVLGVPLSDAHLRNISTFRHVVVRRP